MPSLAAERSGTFGNSPFDSRLKRGLRNGFPHFFGVCRKIHTDMNGTLCSSLRLLPNFLKFKSSEFGKSWPEQTTRN